LSGNWFTCPSWLKIENITWRFIGICLFINSLYKFIIDVVFSLWIIFIRINFNRMSRIKKWRIWRLGWIVWNFWLLERILELKLRNWIFLLFYESLCVC
jgi:hypothetical protein